MIRAAALLIAASSLAACTSTHTDRTHEPMVVVPEYTEARSDSPVVVRPVSTYSIVARDGATGKLGVAVQSHWFSVGSVVPWAEAGVGAVATQSLADVRYGPAGLELMRHGRNANQALDALTSSDPGRAVRQVAMIDAEGNVASHTGTNCIAEAGHATWNGPDGSVYSAQANLMTNPGVAEAMLEAVKTTEGDLADRLLAAMKAAENAGGDIRGKQSAAMLIVAGESTGAPWRDRELELRIEDHPDPIRELARLLNLHRAYEAMNAGDVALEHNDTDGALEAYSKAAKLAPGHAEMAFWTAVSYANAGRADLARPFFETAFADGADWKEVLRRLPDAGLIRFDESTMTEILSITP